MVFFGIFLFIACLSSDFFFLEKQLIMHIASRPLRILNVMPFLLIAFINSDIFLEFWYGSPLTDLFYICLFILYLKWLCA
jgi:hypothetical protein